MKVDPRVKSVVESRGYIKAYHGRDLWQPLSHYFRMAEHHLPHTPAMIWGQPNHRLNPSHACRLLWRALYCSNIGPLSSSLLD